MDFSASASWAPGVYDWTRGRADLTVDRVLVRSSKPGIETISTHSIEDILNDPAIDTVVEVMGGLHPAYEYVSAAHRARGKHVVTANKARRSPPTITQLTALARQHGVGPALHRRRRRRHSVAREPRAL